MVHRSRLFSIAVAVLVGAAFANAQARVSPIEAKDHIGELATVCGQVASARFAARAAGNPTFLNLDRAYPNHIFTALIWGNDRAKFGSPEAGTEASAFASRGRSVLTKDWRR